MLHAVGSLYHAWDNAKFLLLFIGTMPRTFPKSKHISTQECSWA